MPFLLYAATSVLILLAVTRVTRPFSRVAAAILMVLPLLFTGWALVSGRVYGPVDMPYATVPLSWMKEQYGIGASHNDALSDLYCQMIPWRAALRDALMRGEWPLWNRFILSGDVLAAAAQPAAYSPLMLLSMLLPVTAGLAYSAAVTFFVAALGAFLFARELGCRESAALVGAAGWMCSAALAFFVLWPHGPSWAPLPLLLFAVHLTARGPSPRAFALLTALFVVVLLAGHPESAMHCIVVALAYGTMEVLALRTWRSVGVAVASGIAALALCAVYLLPFAEAVTQTVEYELRASGAVPPGSALPDVAARLATTFLPSLHGRTWTAAGVTLVKYESAEVGSIVLALALYALLRLRSRQTRFLAAVAIIGILAYADWAPVSRALASLPLFDITLNDRLSFAAACALSILAALGVEELCRRQRDRSAVVVMLVTLTVLATATWYAQRFVSAELPDYGRHRLLGEFAVGSLALVVVWRWRSIVAPAALLLGAILLQRALTSGDYYVTFPRAAAYPHVPILEPARTAAGPFRIVGHGNALIPGTSTLYGLEDVRGYEAMTLARYARTYPLWCVAQPVWYNRVDDLRRPFLSFLNVRHAVTWDREPPLDGWKVVARQPGSMLLENERVLGRAFVPPHVTVGASDGEALAAMARTADFGAQAWITADLAPHDRPNGPGRIRAIREANLGYELDVEMEGDGWVVTSISAWKGWKAWIDGRRVQTTIANTAFVSVYVPQGAQKVLLRYQPDSFLIGRWISLGTAIALLGVGLGNSTRGSRAPVILSREDGEGPPIEER